MGDTKSVLIKFDVEFYDSAKRAAGLDGMNFSEFVRRAIRDACVDVCNRNRISDMCLDKWHMEPGGDYSKVRAAKDPNYKKRTLSDKIDKAKKLAKERTNKRKGKETYG